MPDWTTPTAPAAMQAGRGPKVVYRPNHKSFGEFILSDQMRKPVVEVAYAIAHLAGEYAPKRKDRGRVPDGVPTLASSFKVEENAGRLKVDRAFRVKVEVYNEQKAAAPMEFGNDHVKGVRMLGRAGAAHGDFHSGKRDLPT